MNIFKINKALKLLSNEKKIRSLTWEDSSYIMLRKEDNAIIDNKYIIQCHVEDFKKCFDCYNDWEEYIKPLSIQEIFEALKSKKCISYEPYGEHYYYLSDDCDYLFNEKYQGQFSFMDVFLKHSKWYIVDI